MPALSQVPVWLLSMGCWHPQAPCASSDLIGIMSVASPCLGTGLKRSCNGAQGLESELLGFTLDLEVC